VATCAACGAENRDNARFCDECGATLAAAPPRTEQRKVVTVLFCDVAGSTALGDRLDPEALRRVHRRLLAIEVAEARVVAVLGSADRTRRHCASLELVSR